MTMSNSVGSKMNVAFISRKFSAAQDKQEKAIGEFLEDELYYRGIITKFPSFTDWGYVFRVRLRNREFDIIVEKIKNVENKVSISFESTLNRIEKLIGKKDYYECKSLGKIIDDILRVNSEFKEIIWS